jgi:hypothetical protein
MLPRARIDIETQAKLLGHFIKIALKYATQGECGLDKGDSLKLIP